MSLNPNAEKWVTALESGEFTQRTAALTVVRPDGNMENCCLGVGCELYLREHPDYPHEDLPNGMRTYGPDRRKGYLPAEVREWLGLSEWRGAYAGGHSLADDNDTARQPFERIAKTVRSEPKGLFRGDQ